MLRALDNICSKPLSSEVGLTGQTKLEIRNFHVHDIQVLHLQSLSGIAARPLEVRKLDITFTAPRMWPMLHSGPSPRGKGHKSEKQDAPIQRQSKQSVPSP
ncbi:hypothetical protein CR513_13941, partial [Mucuna pruriens]